MEKPKYRPLWVITVAATGLGIVLFGGTERVRPSGPFGENLEAEIRGMAATAGTSISSEGCSMMGNLNPVVTCPLVSLPVPEPREAALAAGWRINESQTAFIKGNLRLSIEAQNALPYAGVVSIAQLSP